ncbi:hypothetical protein MFRU_006g03840 [Monilinia fructicola]|nr:hypothetical protein MFRU_006g03840 [Monilinia fructicola]
MDKDETQRPLPRCLWVTRELSRFKCDAVLEILADWKLIIKWSKIYQYLNIASCVDRLSSLNEIELRDRLERMLISCRRQSISDVSDSNDEA